MLIRASAMFKVIPAEYTYLQEIKLRPNEYHYEESGKEPYIKYTCQICEQIAKATEKFQPAIENGRFNSFSFPKGTKQCPCCGINIDWNYKRG